MVYILVELLFFSEKKKTGTRLSVFYIHVHNTIILLACKYYDMKERNEKKNKWQGVFCYLYNLDGQS